MPVYYQLTPFVPQFVGSSGAPLSNGTLNIYLAGTTTPSTLYTDDVGTATGAVITLNTRGYPSISGNTVLLYGLSGVEYKFVLKDRTGAIIYTIDDISIDSGLRTDLAAPTGTDLIGYGSRTLTDRLNDIVSVAQFPGFDETGATDSTAAVQAAVVYAESLNSGAPVEVRFPAGAIVDLKMVFIEDGGIKLNGNGCKIVQNHDSVNSTLVDGPGTYKVSAAFFLKRGATDVEITGFDFTTDDASFPVQASGFGSYFPSIGGHHFTRLYIHNNRFRGGQDRFMFTQAGKYLRFENNNVENNGATIHNGYAGNVYFHDLATDVSVKYSPIAPSIINNVFDGFDSDRSTTLLHLTGATEFVVNNNKFRNVSLGDAGTMRVIQLYSNDFGPFDEDGNALAEIQGVCCGNIIEGTFTHGINVDGESEQGVATWTASFQMRILVEGNNIKGTGNGIRIAEAQFTRVLANYVSVTGSPIFIERRLGAVNISNNYLACTLNGYNESTIYCGWAAGTGAVVFNHNNVITPVGGKYALNTNTPITWFQCVGNNFQYAGAVSGGRPVVLTVAGKCWFKDNICNYLSTLASATFFVIIGSGTRSSINMENNDVVGSGSGGTSLKFCSIEKFNDVNIHRNITSGAIIVEDTDRAYIQNNTVILPSSNANPGITCDNTGYAYKALVEIHGNYILQGTALNTNGIRITSNNDASLNTLSKVTMNRIEGNSTGSLLTQINQGELAIIGNTLINNGVGGTTPTVTGSATLVSL